MDESNNGRPFTTGACLRCGMEAVGGICADCLNDLADYLEGVDIEGLARWASAWPGGRGATIAAAAVSAAQDLVTSPTSPTSPSAPVISQRKARVRFRKAFSAGCPGKPGAVRFWQEGEISTMWQVSTRHGAPLDREHDLWWTDFDIDYAFIAPAEAVEVLAVLEERVEGGEVSRGHA